MYSPRQLEAVRVNICRCDLTVSPKRPQLRRAPFKTEHNEMSVLDAAAKPGSKYYTDLFSMCQQNYFFFFLTSPALCTKAADGTWGQCETLLFSPSIPHLPQARDFRMRRAAKPVPLGALGTWEWKLTPQRQSKDTGRTERGIQPDSPNWKPALGAAGCRRGSRDAQGWAGLGWGGLERTVFLAQTRKERRIVPTSALLFCIVDFILPNGGRPWDHRVKSLAYLVFHEGQGMGEGFQSGSVVTNLPASAEDMGSIPGSGRSPGKGNSNPLQYSCLGNPMSRGAWWL